ncbi:hypothetical protein J3R30DRAFT_413851 [Lentinula aciculospora]|uniref:Polynucleotide 5'-hydroxyl-kinase GRC3 n=1 Tax=Lentinula aciculospora TaxID=153920 RepID=A0A9W9A8I2_9AGAR|nr:hypothetical protein J3R30DRAFT_413851 [Lentinula aciculospora]
MLSAIAARKAAAAVAAASSGDEAKSFTPSTSASTSTSSIPQTSSSPKSMPTLSSKRKRSQGALSDISTPLQTLATSPSASLTEKKRKKDFSLKKSQKPPALKPRYFELQTQVTARTTEVEDGFHRQEDTIVLDDDEEDWDNSDVEDDGIVEKGVEGREDTTTTTRKEKTTRSYSPSQPIPLNDSSEDEEVVQAGSSTQPGRPQLLTTFIPISGQNTFYLSADEVSYILPSQNATPATLVALNSSDTLTLLGTYRLTVVRGSIEIGGAFLYSRSSHNVFAPRSSPLPCIHVLSTSSSSTRLPPKFQNVSGDCALIVLQELHTGVEGLGQVCRTFDGVFSVHPRDVLNREDEDLQLKGVQIVTHQSKHLSPLIIPSSWKHALDEVYTGSQDEIEMDVDENIQESPPKIYLVKGPKKIGKSSFARTLVNRLLSRHKQIAYLDLDPGQSEFTPGGLLALTIVSDPIFGPPFTHPTIPIRAHFLGAFSPKTSPGLYVEGLKDLVQFWARDVQQHVAATTNPLVVNTMGWAKGLGADLSKRVQDILLDGLAEVSFEASLAFGSGNGKQPANMHLYEFDQSQTMYQIPPPPPPSNRYAFFGHGVTSTSLFSSLHTPPQIQIHQIEPAPGSDSTTSTFSAADHRAINIMSYFHAVFPSNTSISSEAYAPSSVTAFQWDTSLPLLARPPYQVDVGHAIDRVFLIGVSEAGEVVREEIERVLGGAVVALVKCEPGTLDEVQSKEMKTKIPYFPSSASPASYPSPSNSFTIGLALLRSVAPGGSHLHILTPIPNTILASAPAARVLIKGEMELPMWGMVDFRSLGRKQQSSGDVVDCQRDTPFLQWDKPVGVGAEKRRVRRNLMRKGQGV